MQVRYLFNRIHLHPPLELLMCYTVVRSHRPVEPLWVKPGICTLFRNVSKQSRDKTTKERKNESCLSFSSQNFEECLGFEKCTTSYHVVYFIASQWPRFNSRAGHLKVYQQSLPPCLPEHTTIRHEPCSKEIPGNPHPSSIDHHHPSALRHIPIPSPR